MKLCLGLGEIAVRLPGATDPALPGFDAGVFDRPISSIIGPIFALVQPGGGF